MNDSPNPGSQEAIDKGCTCPVLVNQHGDGCYTTDGIPMFWISETCPIHGINKTSEVER
jgi:hypothetical protein